MTPVRSAHGHNFLRAVLSCLILLAAGHLLRAAEPVPSFEREIAPLLTTHCLKCHQGKRAKGDLDLTHGDRLLAGGSSGPVVTPGKAADSLLFQYVHEGKMPPRKPLSLAQIDLLRRWIDAGAKWQGPALKPPRTEASHADRQWWSLQPIRRPPLPSVSRPHWIRTP